MKDKIKNIGLRVTSVGRQDETDVSTGTELTAAPKPDSAKKALQTSLNKDTGKGTARSYVMTGKQREAWIKDNIQQSSYVVMDGEKAVVRVPTTKIRRKAVKVFVAVLALICLMLSFPAGKLIAARFVIKQLKLDNEGSFTAGELAAAVGIAIDDSLFGAGSSKNENRLLETYPSLKTCAISAKINGDVVFSYTEYEPLVYFETAQKFYSADKNLYVIEESDSPDKFVNAGLIFVKLPEIRTALCGEILEFAGTDGEYIREFLEFTAGMPQKFDLISFENRFSVYSETENGCTVNYGTVSDLENKILLVSRVLEYETVPLQSVIDVSCGGKASVRGKKQTGG